MATINAPTLQDVQDSGNHGAVHAQGTVTFAATPIADKVRLVRLYAGTKIYATRFVNAALGVGSTISVGFEYVNGEAGGGAANLIPATTSAAVSRVDSTIAPIFLPFDAYVTATVGGGAATGLLDVVVVFEHKGTL